ncbi:actin cytoskeleton and mitosis protein [Conoideocrella luteorostrata]|uniref:Actin cytoskeleton and mitosis protein n=1 Tax=Conoideocrella luteorostrata TaxID=1105319 RepID=A0AAJ0CNL0_9HYPO|nr:actin cytoskeleton and mitosis protein [Conoideocrella luteorostrata]
MFSSFAQGTRDSAPVVNPFAAGVAAAPFKSETNPFGVDGTGDQNKTKRKPANNPFQTKDVPSLSDGGAKHKGKRSKKPRGKDGHGNPRGHDGENKNGLLHAQQQHGESSRATSPSSVSSVDPTTDVAVVPYNSADPLARKVYERLRKDGISPPSWPSQPGNPKNKQAMAKFREQYETYRKKVRASLTKAGLIDDPEKRKALSDAIEFKGICEDMCPEFEKITRITELDVVHAEKDPQTTYANTTKMVKKLARSAAGQEAPLPMDVRSVPALRRSLDYLLDDLLRNDGNLSVVHGFLWDRTRAIRRDFSFFSSLTPDEIKTQVYVLENIARFHVTSLHLLSQEGKASEDFVQQQELEQLGKALLSLRDVYDDCGEQGVKCENESEFRAYYLLFHARDPSILENLQRQWKPHHWRDSDDVRTAVSLVEALQTTQDFHGPLKEGPSLAASATSQAYFRIVRDPKVSYTMACFAECHFPQLRRSILRTIKRALSRPKDPAKDVTAAMLNNFLQFDTVQQAIDFAELHNFEFESDPSAPSDFERKVLVLDGKRSLPHRRLQHQYSQKLVERKRSSRPLPEVIHRTVFEDPNAVQSANGLGSEGSLFVEDDGLNSQPKPTVGGFGTAVNGTFVAPSFGGAGFAPIKAVDSQQASNSTSFGLNSQQSDTLKSPFATLSTASDNPPPRNPFASTGSTGSSPSLFAPKNDHNKDNGSNPFGKGPQTPANAFATISDSTTKKSLFGETKPTFPSTTASSQAAFLGTGNNESTSAFSSAGAFGGSKATPPSFSMPPPPIPQPKVLPTNTNAPPNTQAHSSATFSAQEKSAFGLGQMKLPATSQLGSTSFSDSTSTKPSASTTDTPPSLLTKPPSFLGTDKKPSVVPSEAPFPAISPLATAKPPFSATQPTSGTPIPPTSGQSSSLSSSLPNFVAQFIPVAQAPSSSPGKSATTATAPEQPQPPAPPRDSMGDFTKWFVMGDNGILEQFQVFMIDTLIRGTFDDFEKEVKEKRRKEEEERTNEEVMRFRTYNLSLKFFYRWKQNAREKRLSALRRSGRDQLRAFYASQQLAARKAQKEAARKEAKQWAEVANVNRPEEFMSMLKRKNMSRGEARDALLSSGVLSGVSNERDVVESIVREEFRSRTDSISSSYQSGESSPTSTKKIGAKTKALREMYLGKPGRFRRSLPSTSSRESEPPANARSTSNVSARWRLKAMGIEQLPDGTAVPASMAYDMRSRPSYYSSLAFGSTVGGNSIRRASVSGGSHTLGSPIRTMGIPTVDNGSATNKRKRSFGGEMEEAAGNNTTAERGKHKRIMSEAEKLTTELKAIRKELEEGREWFKSQNERLRSESHGPEPPWFDDSI